MNFKSGDRIRIKTEQEFKEEFKLKQGRSKYCNLYDLQIHCTFSEEMTPLLNQVGTIIEGGGSGSHLYQIEFDSSYLTDFARQYSISSDMITHLEKINKGIQDIDTIKELL